MEFLYAIILGVVQGVTEFLPVSSSGHLVVLGKYLDIGQPGILFEVILHAGTLFAVVWHFREKLLALRAREIGLIVLGSIPAGIAGILFDGQIEGLFSLTKLVGFAFLVTAYVNFQTDRQSGKRETIDRFDAISIGVVQAMAIIPGISRSGSTIFAGTKMNLSKTRAAEFSFLLFIPAIAGANLVELIKYSGENGFSLGLSVVGFIAAFISGLLAIKFLMTMLVNRNLKIFSYYLVVVGVITILFL